jgi:hypothetical protein
MHWGSGQIIEEATYQGEHHVPAVQLMEYTEGEAAGTLAIRFAHFNERGQFQRSPLMIGEVEIDALREAVGRTPRLRALLLRIAGAEA